jgi:tRNA (guanine10-N2)-dimethyltransferase
MIKIKLSSENQDLSRFEVETLLNKKTKKRGKYLFINNISKNYAISKLENSALVKKIYFEDGSDWKNDTSPYKGRFPKDKPAFHPTVLKPKMARLICNLANSKSILDPFCGSASILIEGAVLGKEVSGIDYDSRMIERAKINLNHYKIKPKLLKKYDALKINELFKNNSVDSIVCDPPYGQSSTTSNSNIRQLFKQFMENSYPLLKKGSRLVIIIPSKLSINRLIYPKYKKLGQFNWYVHGGLTRRFFILQK